jgi:hypothetical protein
MNIEAILPHRTDTWPTYSQMLGQTNKFMADFLRKIYHKGVFVEIKEIMDKFPNCKSVGHVVLLAECAAIDSLSAYLSGGGQRNNKSRYTDFISRYFPSAYTGKGHLIYESFRCDNVHGWNLHKSMISGFINDPGHLDTSRNHIYISLYDFFSDIVKAFDNYCQELEKDDNLKKMFLKRYKEIKDTTTNCGQLIDDLPGCIRSIKKQKV